MQRKRRKKLKKTFQKSLFLMRRILKKSKMQFHVIIGSVGVVLLLLAFFLNLFKILTQDTKTYALMNIIGAGLAGYASILLGFIPFVILEGIWFIVAVVKLATLFRK